jgi:hypothetical protein
LKAVFSDAVSNKPLTLADKNVDIGSNGPVAATGYPGRNWDFKLKISTSNNPKVLDEGSFTALPSTIKYDGLVKGMSGGPAFNKDLQVIGINYAAARWFMPFMRDYGTSVKELRNLINIADNIGNLKTLSLEETSAKLGLPIDELEAQIAKGKIKAFQTPRTPAEPNMKSKLEWDWHVIEN